jgi:serine/threonine protein kinase
MDEYQAGDRLDHFVIEATVFEGALTRVYRARDMLTDVPVALKVPFGDILNQPVLYYHLQNEQRIGPELDHPNVVRFIQRDQTRQYTIMEFLPGKDLKAHLISTGRCMAFDDAREIVQQAAEALGYLHGRGIHHLDIKPENIMVLPDGSVKLLDFGLARWAKLPDLLAVDFIEPFGTPYYIAPEQLTGIRDDPRSDIYSLAVVLYEMLTGNLPYQRSLKLSKARHRLRVPPTPPRHYVPDLSPAIQEILLKALERKPGDRYPSVQAFQRDLANPARVALSERSRDTRKPKAWRDLRPLPTFARASDRGTGTDAGSEGPMILGAVMDDDLSDLVAETVRRQAMLNAGQVTLLTVTEPSSESDFTRFGRAVEGGRLQARLDRYVQQLRRYNLDPIIRIRTGDVVAEILATAKHAGASLLVLGPSRQKGLRRIFGGRTADKIMRKSPCPVMVAEPETDEPFPDHVDFSALNTERVVQIEFFLIDCWVSHLNYLSELIFQLLYDRRNADQALHQACRLGRWLDMVRYRSAWSPLVERIDPIHENFHAVAVTLVEKAREEGLGAMRAYYIREALPVSCSIREALRDISTMIREQTAFAQAGLSDLLGEGVCPISREGVPPGDPLYKAHQIRDYFCEHPDAAPEACLRHIDTAAGGSDAPKGK